MGLHIDPFGENKKKEEVKVEAQLITEKETKVKDLKTESSKLEDNLDMMTLDDLIANVENDIKNHN